MKTLVWIACLAMIFSSSANAQQHVRGHYRQSNPYSQSQYVQPHYRSSPDSSYNNNWSVRPNANPYSGQRGSLSPTWNDRAPSQSFYGNPYNSRRSGYGR